MGVPDQELPDLDIAICCRLKNEAFLYFCLYTMVKTAKFPEKLNFLIGIDFGHEKIDESRIVGKEVMMKLHPRMKFINIHTGFQRSSLSHGIALNELVKHSENQFCVLSDADLAYTLKGWDEVFLRKMVDEHYDAWGVPYVIPYMYKHFPTVTLLCLNMKKCKEYEVDFRPTNWHHTHLHPPDFIVDDEETSRIFQIPIGNKLRLETGAECTRAFVEHGDKYGVMEHVFKKGLFGANFVYQGKLFAAHHRRSSNVKKKQETLGWISKYVGYFQKQLKIDIREAERNLKLVFGNHYNKHF